jgi:hypothetical protein
MTIACPDSLNHRSSIDELVTYLDLLGLDRVRRYDSMCGGGRVEGTTLGKCP